MSLVSSAPIRSADTADSRPAIAVIAACTSGTTVKPSCAANRAARSIRSASSLNESSGDPGVRSTRAFRSRMPPNGSTISSEGSRTATALTVKSRRARSASSDRPYATRAGLRDSGRYCSLRYVVISQTRLPRRRPTVPNSIPISQIVSAQPAAIFRTSPGRASVARSRSP